MKRQTACIAALAGSFALAAAPANAQALSVALALAQGFAQEEASCQKVRDKDTSRNAACDGQAKNPQVVEPRLKGVKASRGGDAAAAAGKLPKD